MSQVLKLHIKALLDFYDDCVPDSVGHATAINAVLGEELAIGLAADYFQQRGDRVRLVNRSGTQGQKTGKRLDAWLEISTEDGVFHYQTEIKNWSAHAINGRNPPKVQDEVKMGSYRINRWLNQFDSERKTLKQDGARKVLTPMKPQQEGWVVRPLIVFWDAMHPKGESAAFFDVDVAGAVFERLWVFSMSSHVRGLFDDGIDSIDIEMPESLTRLNWLDRLVRQ